MDAVIPCLLTTTLILGAEDIDALLAEALSTQSVGSSSLESAESVLSDAADDPIVYPARTRFHSGAQVCTAQVLNPWLLSEAIADGKLPCRSCFRTFPIISGSS